MKVLTANIRTDQLPRPIGKNCRIFCTEELSKKLYSVFNENNMTALQNYADKSNSKIFFSYLPNDIFHNTQMSVYKDKSIEGTKTALQICLDSKDDFVNSLRTIYNFASESVKKLSQK